MIEDNPREQRSEQLNFRISHSEMLTLKAVAEELDFPYTTLARRIVKQYLRKYLEEKEARQRAMKEHVAL